MKRLFAFLFAAAILATAQSIGLSVAPASVAPGGIATLSLTYTDAVPSANIAGIEWSLTLPAGVTAGASTLGAASSGAAKVLTCGPAICLLIGNGATPNETAIGSGVLATIPVTVSAATAPGALSISLAAVSGATGPGLLAAVTTTPATLTVSSKYDLNGDGSVTTADITLMLNITDGTTATCAAPASGVGDGKCGLIDVELEILAVLGVIH